MRSALSHRLAGGLALWLGSGCASTVVPAEERTVRDEFAALVWAPATPADLPGHWRVRSIQGPAAAVLMDLAYWMDGDGRFSGAALFAGPPPTYEVLSGRWTFLDDGTLQLGEDSEPARVEVAAGWLRLSGAEGSLILERAQIR